MKRILIVAVFIGAALALVSAAPAKVLTVATLADSMDPAGQGSGTQKFPSWLVKGSAIGGPCRLSGRSSRRVDPRDKDAPARLRSGMLERCRELHFLLPSSADFESHRTPSDPQVSKTNAAGSWQSISRMRENTLPQVALMPTLSAANSSLCVRSIAMMQSSTATAAKNSRSRLKNCR